MKFAYIGLKTDGERAFKEKTGVEWMPGSVHDVTDPDVCAEMLKHKTIWEPVGKADVSLASAKKPLPFSGPVTDDDVTDKEDAAKNAKPAEPTTPTEPTKTDPLADLDDAGVRAYAKAQGLKIQGLHLLKGANLRARVMAALPG